MNPETFRLSQKELQRVAVISSCVKGTLECARAAELLDITASRHIKRLQSSLSALRQAQPLWHTPAAGRGLATAACPSACGSASCSWPVPPMPASTTITFAKNWPRRNDLSLGRKETLRRLLRRSAGIGSPSQTPRAPSPPPAPAWHRAREGEDAPARRQPAPLAGRSRPAGAAYFLLGFLDDATRKVPGRRILPHRRRAWLFPPAPPPVASLWRALPQFPTGIATASSFATTITWSVEEQLCRPS